MQKIAIIGGGPAGLTAAIEGAKQGLDVDLFDQYAIGDNIRCAEGFFDTMNMLGKPDDGIRFKVDTIDFKVKNNYSFQADDKVNLWMIDRSEWQIGLAQQARDLGVRIHEHSSVSKERLKELQQSHDWVIDGSGAPSVTSKAYGWQSFYKETSGLTVQFTMHGDFSKYEDKIYAAILDKYAGYYWIFPKGVNEANVGLIVFNDTKDNLWHELERIIELEGLTSYVRTRKLGGICPVVIPNQLVYDNALLTGDAAGLVSALHGGGIDNACVSAKIAIECIVNGEVEQYGQKIHALLGKKLDGEQKFADIAYQISPLVLDTIFKFLVRSEKTLGEYGFLTGDADGFLKLRAIKNFIPPFLKKSM
ncbi:MAG: NAD(P)/FAD-dependent oxidoreductase [Lysinibacillus sp.]